MTEPYQPIAELLQRVRSRWRRLVLWRAIVRAALAAAAVVVCVLIVARWMPPSPLAVALLGVSGLALVLVALAWGMLPVRHVPSDARLARFVEEQKGGLEQRLVSAVDVATLRDADARPAFALSMVRDAARVAATIDPTEIVRPEWLRRAGFQAAAASCVFLLALFFSRTVAHQSLDAMSLALFPSHIVLEVTPGDARVQSGAALVVNARLIGNSAPVVAQLLRAQGDEEEWRGVEMKIDPEGHFTVSLNALATSFRYRVTAGGVTSNTYTVSVVHAPRVARIDVEYTYPKAFRLPPRIEENGGDIYAPAGTDVRLRVHTDPPAATGRMLLGNDTAVELSPADGMLTASLKITEDGSYRVALADATGLSSRDETEYFIRTMDDRPPEIHVVRPASDRRVTALEEVEIEAEAEDDFGVASLDLVYAVRGGKEQVVPIRIPAQQTSVTGRHTMYLEDLDVHPGDFVSYYLRARDLPRGKRASEVRSDIFFLEIKNFEEEFTLAQSQAAMGGGASNSPLDDLVAAQKDVIVATWKLDRRSQAANGAQSKQDIGAVATAEGEVKARVERASNTFRASNMRDPRARPQVGRGGPAGPGRASNPQAPSGEDAMSAAALAMGTAVTALNALKTADAVTPEMEALNHLLKAQADVKKREVQQQQAGGGSGSNRNSQDLSSLFDKELARHQQTNYETPAGSRESNKDQGTAVDKIKELARRQDELLKRQQALAKQRGQLSAEELKRELEKLTRDQNELRQRAEEMAQQMARRAQGQSDPSAPSNPQQGQQSQSGQQSPGQQSQGGQQGQSSGQGSQPGQQGQPRQGQGQQAHAGQPQGASGRSGDSGRQMREISEEMRNAASELRRQDADQATSRAARALDKLRDLERQMQNGSADGRRRALGDLQLEARQLADAQRQIASEQDRSGDGPAGQDTLRRLAGEQERLADRLRQVQEGLKQQGNSGAASKDSPDVRNLQQAAGDAGRDIEHQRLAERMEQSAQGMRAQAGQEGAQAGNADAQGAPGGSNGAGESAKGTPAASGSPQSQQEIARALDRLADRLAAVDRGKDDESQKLTGQLARAQELRAQLDDLNRQMETLDRQASASQSPSAGQQPGGREGRAASPSAGRSTGESGKPGQGQGGSSSTSGDVDELRAQVNRQIDQVRELMKEAQRDEGTAARGGAGSTFEGQGMTLSAPGTEGFKQDFATWQELKRQATMALDAVESSVAKRLQEKESKDRLTAGSDDRPPAEYQEQVDSYFKALASRQTP